MRRKKQRSRQRQISVGFQLQAAIKAIRKQNKAQQFTSTRTIYLNIKCCSCLFFHLKIVLKNKKK